MFHSLTYFNKYFSLRLNEVPDYNYETKYNAHLLGLWCLFSYSLKYMTSDTEQMKLVRSEKEKIIKLCRVCDQDYFSFSFKHNYAPNI